LESVKVRRLLPCTVCVLTCVFASARIPTRLAQEWDCNKKKNWKSSSNHSHWLKKIILILLIQLSLLHVKIIPSHFMLAITQYQFTAYLINTAIDWLLPCVAICWWYWSRWWCEWLYEPPSLPQRRSGHAVRMLHRLRNQQKVINNKIK
jgi:hypothetical protein